MIKLTRSAYHPAWLHIALLASASSLAVSCGDEDVGRVVEDPIAEGLLPADWPGLQLGVAPPKFVEVGKAERTDKPSKIPTRSVADLPFEEISETEFEVVDLKRGLTFEATLPDGIDRVATARAQQLASMAAKDPMTVEPTTRTDKLITGGADTRVALGFAQGVGKEGWLAAIGMLQFGGTATLIGPNVALTAAHAVLDPSSGRWISHTFIPREDWTDRTVNSAMPYGDWKIADIIVPLAYTRNRCWAEEHADNCDQYDIAFLRLERSAEGEGHRWWFTPAAETRQQLLTRQLKNRGYPTCYEDDPPPGCLDMTLYGDALDCQLGPDRYAPADGWSSNIFHGCDTNDGHSGSPMFYYRADGPPVLVGVHTGSFPMYDSPTKNAFKRLTPNTMTWIHGLL